MGMTTSSLEPEPAPPIDLSPGLEMLQDLLEPKEMARKRQFVYCTFRLEGYHQFPEAGFDPSFKTDDFMDVSHLANRHMHYFDFKVWVEVRHSNRNVEFIQLRRWIMSLYQEGTLELNDMSCEMISDALHQTLVHRYPVSIRIDVSEEGINGSYTEYDLD